MRILAVSDIHGAVDELERIVRRVDDADVVIAAGDLTDTSMQDYEGTARAVIEVLDGAGDGFVKAVPGNMDDERVLRMLIEHRINLHKNMFSLGDYEFIGFGGGDTPFDTPFEPDDSERGEVLNTLLERTNAPNKVIVSHMPPRNTRIDRTADNQQVGSPTLREIVDAGKVRLVISGHIHEAAGVDRLGDTVMVNPGPVKDGRYAVIDAGEDIDVQLK